MNNEPVDQKQPPYPDSPWSDLPDQFQVIPERRGPLAGDPEILGVDTDAQAVALWLEERCSRSESTYRAYAREAERLLLWAAKKQGKVLSELTRRDFLAYQEFLLDPQPSKDWVMDRRYARTDSRWRPFLGPLKTESAHQSQKILHSMMSWLVSNGWLIANPVPQLKSRRRAVAGRAQKSLSAEHKAFLMGAVESMNEETPKEVAYKERARWILRFFFGLGARIDEACQSTMSSFQVQSFKDGSSLCWHILGKGRVSGMDDADSLPLSAKVAEGLYRFRNFLGLAPYPTSDELIPVFPSFASMDSEGQIDLARAKGLSASRVYKIVKELMNKAAEEARLQGKPEIGVVLERSSTHSLRHTAIREVADTTDDLRLVQVFARHGNINTTTIYTTPDQDQLRKVLQSKESREDGG